jgi:hypothetical protein
MVGAGLAMRMAREVQSASGKWAQMHTSEYDGRDRWTVTRTDSGFRLLREVDVMGYEEARNGADRTEKRIRSLDSELRRVVAERKMLAKNPGSSEKAAAMGAKQMELQSEREGLQGRLASFRERSESYTTETWDFATEEIL